MREPIKSIKFAVIGCGHIGKRHAEMIMRNPEGKLIALCDILSKEELDIDGFKVPFYTSYDKMLEQHPEIEVINIATPNGFHFRHAMIALDAGKHIVVEKPFTLSKSDAEKIAYKALNINKLVFSVMQNRYSPPSIWIKNLIDSGRMGEIFLVQLNCYWNRDKRYYKPDSWHGQLELDGGTLFTQFSHFIDILYWLFGDLKNISSRFFNFNHGHLTELNEDSGIITFDFKKEGSGVLNFSTSIWDKNLESSMTIISEKGTIKIGGQYMEKVEYCHLKDYKMPKLKPTNPGNDYGTYKGSAQNHDFVIENVIRVLNSQSSITTNLLEAMKVIEIIESIYNSSKS